MLSAAAIVLAAGASSRMGRIKALAPVAPGGEIAVRHLAVQMLRLCGECIVVTGYHHAEVEAALQGMDGVSTVRNPAPERGQLSSLQTGLAALRGSAAEWLLFAPVDCMAIDATVMDALGEAMQAAAPETLLCIPRHGERRGHPVALRSVCAAAFLALGVEDSARTVIHDLRHLTAYAEVPTGGFLLDIDHPEDYEQLLARQRSDEGSAAR